MFAGSSRPEDNNKAQAPKWLLSIPPLVPLKVILPTSAPALPKFPVLCVLLPYRWPKSPVSTMTILLFHGGNGFSAVRADEQQKRDQHPTILGAYIRHMVSLSSCTVRAAIYCVRCPGFDLVALSGQHSKSGTVFILCESALIPGAALDTRSYSHHIAFTKAISLFGKPRHATMCAASLEFGPSGRLVRRPSGYIYFSIHPPLKLPCRT